MAGRYVPGTGSVRTHYHLRGKYQSASRYYYCSSPLSSLSPPLSGIERTGSVWALTPRTLRDRNLQQVSTEESHSPLPPPRSVLDKNKTNTLHLHATQNRN